MRLRVPDKSKIAVFSFSYGLPFAYVFRFGSVCQIGIIDGDNGLLRCAIGEFVTGIQLRFADNDERQDMQEYVAYVKKRYKL